MLQLRQDVAFVHWIQPVEQDPQTVVVESLKNPALHWHKLVLEFNYLLSEVLQVRQIVVTLQVLHRGWHVVQKVSATAKMNEPSGHIG